MEAGAPQPLPMVPASCSLDGPGLSRQVERYRAVGHAAELVRSEPRRLAIRVSDQVSERLVEELLAVERECCPFFEIGWDATSRMLSYGVAAEAEAPALDAIAYAMGLEAGRAVATEAGPTYRP